MMAREKGDWERVETYAVKLNLSIPFVNQAYIEAMEWAYQMTKAAHVQGNKVSQANFGCIISLLRLRSH